MTSDCFSAPDETFDALLRPVKCSSHIPDAPSTDFSHGTRQGQSPMQRTGHSAGCWLPPRQLHGASPRRRFHDVLGTQTPRL